VQQDQTKKSSKKGGPTTPMSKEDTLALIDVLKVHDYTGLGSSESNPRPSDDKEKILKTAYEECVSATAARSRYSMEAFVNRWKNLKQTYRKMKDVADKSGSGAITWPYFEPMQEILSGDAACDMPDAMGTDMEPDDDHDDTPPTKRKPRSKETLMSLVESIQEGRERYMTHSAKEHLKLRMLLASMFGALPANVDMSSVFVETPVDATPSDVRRRRSSGSASESMLRTPDTSRSLPAPDNRTAAAESMRSGTPVDPPDFDDCEDNDLASEDGLLTVTDTL
jgi:hypothetical protein